MGVRLLLLTVLGMTAQAHGYTLLDAWGAVHEHNADYSAARYTRDAGLEQAKQARGALLPQVSANASYTYQPPSVSSTQTAAGWNVQLNQVVFDKSKWARYRQAKIGAQMAQQQFSASDDDLVLKASQAAADLLQSRANLESIRSEKAAYALQIQQAQAQFDAGAATIVDTYQARAGFDAAVAKEVSELAHLHASENTLADATGLDPDKLQGPRVEALDALTLPEPLSWWQAQALEHNPEYQYQTLAAQQAEAALDAARGEHWPKLTASAGYQDMRYHTASTDYSQRSKGPTYGLQLTIPLLSGGVLTSQSREAAAKLGAAQAQRLSSERKIRLQIKQAYDELRAGQAQIIAQQHALESARLKRDATAKGKDYGFNTRLEVLQAEQGAAEAQQKLTQARYQYLMTYLTLLKTAGLLHEPRFVQTLKGLEDK